MGINFSHTDAAWSYMGFGLFREKLAAEIGITLSEMKGFERFGSTQDGKSWDGLTDPIIPLLDHSDCDGELSADECRTIAPRLRELVDKWPEDDYDREKALELAKGMEDAFGENEALRFT